jgi:signal transduction histidine kinase
VAIAGLIGTPRFDNDLERLRGKEYPQNRVLAEAVSSWIRQVGDIVQRGDVEREEEFSRRLDALHEIRRFNQIIKTNMERVCEKESPSADPDEAPVELVRAYRASSLISLQLDALDLLANPVSAMSFAPRPWVFYKIVDKIVRIYRVIADGRDVRIRLSGASLSRANVDQRTVHIIPSVFIDNAVKYSKSGEAVDVHISEDARDKQPVITLSVRSYGPMATDAEERALFLKRARGSIASGVAEGSGVGLTLAKVVSDQHKGWITAEQRLIGGDRAEWTFTFQIPRL